MSDLHVNAINFVLMVNYKGALFYKSRICHFARQKMQQTVYLFIAEIQFIAEIL